MDEWIREGRESERERVIGEGVRATPQDSLHKSSLVRNPHECHSHIFSSDAEIRIPPNFVTVIMSWYILFTEWIRNATTWSLRV